MTYTRRTFLKTAGIAAILAAFGGITFINQAKVGAGRKDILKQKVINSPYYIDGEFKNFEPIVPTAMDKNFISSMKDIVMPPKGTVFPDKPFPVVKTDLKSLPKNEDVYIWFGHSSFFMQINGKTILVDPVFSNYASPVFFINKTFPGTDIYKPEDMPDIDVLLISHDHWDHLDYATVMALKSKVKNVVCPLGVGAHFEYWGFSPSVVHEGDWFSSIELADNWRFHILPTRHFSGRLMEKNQTLWAAFALITPQKRIFYSGDGGYGKHFRQIGEMFDGFDIAVMENGQYNISWPQVHMMPEEVAQAAMEIKAQNVVPVHCGKFALSPHYWTDPFNRIKAASSDKNYRLLTPKIGEVVHLNDKNQSFSDWWI